jgi:hypothetical protein
MLYSLGSKNIIIIIKLDTILGEILTSVYNPAPRSKSSVERALGSP